MARPLGITVLSIVLGGLAVAGIGNAIVWNLGAVQSLLAHIPTARPILPTLRGPYFTVVALGYALSAGAASIGLWRMHPWARNAYAAWCATVLLLGVLMAVSGSASTVRVSLLFAAGLTAFVSLGYYYVAKQAGTSEPPHFRST